MNVWRLETVKEALRLAGLALLLFAARSSLADHYYIPSGSMEHTLMAGDRVLVDKRVYGWRVPFTKVTVLDGSPVNRGEVVIFDSPADGTRLIKRVAAVAGDEVVIHDGRLTVNGRAFGVGGNRERFGERVAELNLEHGGGPDAYIAEVPPGTLLTIGDHRGRSRDGRMFGLVAEDDIYGRAIGVYFRRGEAFVWQSL